jgi:hypothetical protein
MCEIAQHWSSNVALEKPLRELFLVQNWALMNKFTSCSYVVLQVPARQFGTISWTISKYVVDSLGQLAYAGLVRAGRL